MIQIAGGSIPGSDHTKPGQPGWTNNHDAYAWKQLLDGGCVAVVCDGCGSGKHSEVGSKIASEILVGIIAQEVEKWQRTTSREMELPWQRIKQKLLTQLGSIAFAMGDSLSQVVNDYFLFTIVGAIVTSGRYCVFNIGDGLYVVNGCVNTFGPFANNSPPYVSYELTGTSLAPELLEFQQPLYGLTANMEWLLIGTDGVSDLIEAENVFLHGKEEPIGPIGQFSEEKFFKNPDLIRRRLAMINREYIDGNRISSGVLRDDTTFVVIKNPSY